MYEGLRNPFYVIFSKISHNSFEKQFKKELFLFFKEGDIEI